MIMSQYYYGVLNDIWMQSEGTSLSQKCLHLQVPLEPLDFLSFRRRVYCSNSNIEFCECDPRATNATRSFSKRLLIFDLFLSLQCPACYLCFAPRSIQPATSALRPPTAREHCRAPRPPSSGLRQKTASAAWAVRKHCGEIRHPNGFLSYSKKNRQYKQKWGEIQIQVLILSFLLYRTRWFKDESERSQVPQNVKKKQTRWTHLSMAETMLQQNPPPRVEVQASIVATEPLNDSVFDDRKLRLPPAMISIDINDQRFLESMKTISTPTVDDSCPFFSYQTSTHLLAPRPPASHPGASPSLASRALAPDRALSHSRRARRSWPRCLKGFKNHLAVGQNQVYS